MPTASTGSSLGGNTASTGSSTGGRTASTGSSTGGRVAKTGSSTGSSQPSVQRGIAPSTKSIGQEVRSIRRETPVGSLVPLLNPDGTADDLYNHDELVNNLNEQYATLIEQKMYAQLLRTMVSKENREFQEWAKSKNINLNTPSSILKFVQTLETGEFTDDAKLNGKVKKVLDFVPDIIGALAKNEAIAPGAKIIKGENPIVDETKFAIEKVIGPTLKKVGTLLEKRLGSELGKKVGKSLINWGEKLITLPTKVLEAIGPADVVASIVDAGLLAIDKATGNYRQINHDLPEEVLSIPVIGPTLEIFSSVRDLIDSAAGIPRDDQAISQMYNNLLTNLWNPAKAQYNDLMKEIANTEGDFAKLAKEAETQSLSNVVYTSLVPAIGLIARQLGNNRKEILKAVYREYGIDKDIPAGVKQTINDIVDAELGRMTPEQLREKMERRDIKDDVPVINAIINGLEVKGRVALDNVYSAETALRTLEDSLPILKQQADEARAESLRIQGLKIKQTARGSIRVPLSSKNRKKLKQAQELERKLRDQIADIENNKLPAFGQKLDVMMNELNNTLDVMDAEGLDTSFIRKSKNWDQMLADAEDDRLFWGGLADDMGFGGFGF